MTGWGIDLDYCNREWFALERNRDHSVIFEIASEYCILNSFVDNDGYSISSKVLFPTVGEIMVIWVKSPIPVHFSSLIPKMLMLMLVIYCLNTTNLLWFMDVKFQVLTQYCSLQHQTLLPSPATSITECCFCFGSICSFFLELFLHWSPVAYWAPTDVENSSFSVLCFCLFTLFMEFSRQEYWCHVPFPSPLGHILSELSTMTHPSWMALHGTAYSFVELDKAVVHVISLISFLWLWFSFCWPSDG